MALDSSLPKFSDSQPNAVSDPYSYAGEAIRPEMKGLSKDEFTTPPPIHSGKRIGGAKNFITSHHSLALPEESSVLSPDYVKSTRPRGVNRHDFDDDFSSVKFGSFLQISNNGDYLNKRREPAWAIGSVSILKVELKQITVEIVERKRFWISFSRWLYRVRVVEEQDNAHDLKESAKEKIHSKWYSEESLSPSLRTPPQDIIPGVRALGASRAQADARRDIILSSTYAM